MKRTYLLIAIILALTTMVFTPALTAQTCELKTDAALIRVGPLASGGASVNTGDVSEGTKTGALPSYTAGVMVDIPFASRFALDISGGYDLRAINFHDEMNNATGVSYRFGYAVIRPTLRYSGLSIGLGAGFPVYTSATGKGGATAPPMSASNLSVLYEGRIGGQVPVLQTKSGSLLLTLEGSLAFNRILFSNYLPGGSQTMNNGPLATSEVGLVYLFDLSRPETTTVAVK